MINNYNIQHYVFNYIQKNSFLSVNELKDELKIWGKQYSFINETLIKKTNILTIMNEITDNKIIIDEDEKTIYWNQFHYKNDHEQSNNKMGSLYRRLIMEMRDLEDYSKINGVEFKFAWCPDHFQALQFVLSSENEPYYGAYFIFHAYFPHDYPLRPPKIHLMTTGGNKIRFNPNLYNNGKVCLSLLGTWSGEQWNPSINNFVHIVQALSVMILTDQPIMNEPAYSSMVYYDHDEENSDCIFLSRKYKFDIKFHSIKFALIEHLMNPDKILGDKILEMFSLKKESILNSCKKYIEKSKLESFNTIIKAKSFQINDENIFNDYTNLFQKLYLKILI